MTTNITEEHRHAFQALTSGDYGNFALFSIFVDAAPAPRSSPSTSVRRAASQSTNSAPRSSARRPL